MRISTLAILKVKVTSAQFHIQLVRDGMKPTDALWINKAIEELEAAKAILEAATPERAI